MEIRKVNDLFVTECMCFPRSGHHALKDVLQTYFGERLVYCEIYHDPVEKQISLESQTNYQKNHDFDGGALVLDSRKYLVQIRDPVDALLSRWQLDTRSGERPNTEQAFRDAMEKWNVCYARFVAKWVWSEVANRLIVRYNDLVTHPYDTVVHAIQFMQGFQNYDASKLKSALAEFPIEAETA